MRIGFEAEFLPTIRATELAFNDVRPTSVILHIRKVGEGWEFDDFPIFHISA
jgi:hypothetical protein